MGVLLFSLGSLWAQSNSTFTGRIMDAKTGDLLPGAVVRVLGASQNWTIANEKGIFYMKLPPNQYKMEVSYIGFQTDTIPVQLRQAQLDTVLFLFPQAFNLSSVTIYAETREMRLRNPEMSIERINAEVVERVPSLFGEVDLLKVVQMLPGVQAASEGSSGFSVRGGSPDQNMIQFDKAALYNASHMLGFFSVFNNDAVGGLSLYKGDIPANYGGRLSSLLDVEPQDGSPEFQVDGGIGIIASRLAVQGRIGTDNLTYLVSGRRTYADLFLPLSSNEIVKNAKINFYDLNGRLHWRMNENNTLNVTLYNGRDRFAAGEMGMNFGNAAGSLSWRHSFSDHLFLKVYGTFTDYSYNFKGTTNRISLSWDSSIQDAGFRADLSFVPNRLHKFDFGYTSNYQWFKPGTAVGSAELASGPSIHQDISMSPRQGFVNVLYFSNEHKILKEIVQLRYGLRLTRFDAVGPTTLYEVDQDYHLINEQGVSVPSGQFYHHQYGWEPRVGLSVLVNPMVSIKASYARTLQYVHLLSFSAAGSPLEIWVPTTPTIKPQSSQQFSLGVFANVFEKKFECSIEGFYKYLDNVLDFKEHPNLLLYDKIETELRFGTGRSYGLEFLVRKNEGKLSGWISYTYSRSFRTIDGVNNGQPYNAPSDRPHNVNLVGFYDFNKRWSVSLNWVYATGQPLTLAEGRYWFYNELVPVYTARNSYRMPDYHRMDASVTVKLGKLNKRWKNELNVSVYNLYARKNPWAINYRLRPTGEQYLEMTYLFSVVPSITWNFSF